ncbi:hypothetical protein [Paraburkholderia flagellata]|uniref:hypothetical protein n=1 Tax=Paraburkholderia flagellata TaxID=2883241 RepID=UPI001F2E10E9|nr:hypothetical protein [Paraburkholderia flagellata]
MTINQNSQLDLEIELKELKAENDLLLHQLYQVQEELENGHLRGKALEKNRTESPHGSLGGKRWVDEELPGVLAENRRLQALVEALREVHRLETQNGLNAKLGDILVKSADSLTALVSVPTKVGKIWIESRRKLPPKSIGGKGFEKVVAAYRDGGFDSVGNLLAKVGLSPAMRASAYTVLARQLMSDDRAAAAEAAHRAYVLDPKPYRLKWFAFRMHEAGSLIEAEALLDIVSPNTQFSESEARQAGQLCREAKHLRESDARRKTEFSERRAEIEKQLNSLKHAKELLEQEKLNLLSSRAEATALAQARGREVEGLRRAKESLEQEQVRLRGNREEVIALAEERHREVEMLRVANESLEQEMSRLSSGLEAVAALAEGRGGEVEILRQAQESLEQEKATLLNSREEMTALAEGRGREVEILRYAKESLEQEKAKLLSNCEEVTALAAGRGREVEILRQAKESLEHEKAKLLSGREEVTALAAGRGREVEILRQEKESLEQEKAKLLSSREEVTALAAGRGREVEILRQAKESLEQEKVKLLSSREEVTTLAEGRAREVEGLKQANASLEQKWEVQVKLVSATEHIEGSLKTIEHVQKQGMSNAVKQIESLIRLQNYLGPDVLLPDVHNWAISPDFGVLLIHLLEQHRYDAVVEFGSGTSTLVLAKALERIAQHGGQPAAPLLSFDHLEQFQRQSQSYLERAGLTGGSRVVWAPLQAWRTGETPYYACEEALWQMRGQLHQDAPRVLVVVDGPPGRTGPLARHPALPKVLQGLGDACCFHFLMDDYDRQDERDIVSSWERGLSQIGRTFTRTEYKQLEKQACLLEVAPLKTAGAASPETGRG